jgi:enolase
MSTVMAVDAWEVLDSRGTPTVRVAVEASDGRGVFTVPAGASTGSHEVAERRDGGTRYGGLGVREAVAAVEDDLAPVVCGREVTDQAGIDAAIVASDGTDDLGNVGGNAALGVSGAVARAASDVRDQPLFRSLAAGTPGRIPLPMVNVLSGGLHAEGGIDIQDFLVVPTGAGSYPEAVETVWAVRRAVRDRILEAGHRPLVADEGGFAPPVDGVEDAFDLLARGVRDAGHEPSRSDVAFGVDVAATHFYDPDREVYELSSLDRELTAPEMVDLVEDWTARYPLVSVEDPVAEDDWQHWSQLQDRLDAVQLLGDDLLVTDTDRLDRADQRGAATAVLVKPNQAGTLTRAIEVVRAAQDRGFAPVVSARSGETSDTTIADLAVALDAGQIKIGSLARSERLAKYNRLLRIDSVHEAGLATVP